MRYPSNRLIAPQPVRGYTLIELVVVMVLLGIVAVFSFQYIGFGAQIYQDTTGREQLVSQTRFAVERLNRELRNALPRSIRVSADDQQRCIEFMPIVTSSNYLQMPRPGPSANDDFIAVEPIRANQLIGNYLFVYATNANFIYGDNDLRRKIITAVTPNASEGTTVIDFTGNPSFFPTNSPARRFYVASAPVSWCYNESLGQLERFTNYGLLATQPSHTSLLGDSAAREVMAVAIRNDLNDNEEWPFRVFEATLQRSSLVQFDWRFRRTSTSEPLQILHEVHIPNVP